ncbi:hypothetical protein Tco_1324583, partial [Tanacetum coccineum]
VWEKRNLQIGRHLGSQGFNKISNRVFKIENSGVLYVQCLVGKQPELDNHVGVGGYRYTAFIPLNIKNGAYAPLKSAFERE